MDKLFQELRIGVRSITRSPGLTGISVLALALGIGLTTTMFSIVNGVILQGLPFEESENPKGFQSEPDFSWRSQRPILIESWGSPFRRAPEATPNGWKKAPSGAPGSRP